MSVEKAFREMIRNEIEAQLRPLTQALSKLQNGAAGLQGLRDLAERLAPLSSFFGGARRRGRPAKTALGAKGRRRGSNDRPCALEGCKRMARSKGYCAAHYQKFRNLSNSNRLPSDWKEYADPNTVQDVVLPRGRAAAKAKALAAKK